MSTVTQEMSPERKAKIDALWQEQTDAVQARDAASEALGKALNDAQAAAAKFVMSQYQLAPTKEEGLAALVNIAYSNRSEYSGGPHSRTNILEALMRQAALALLQRAPHRPIDQIA